MKLNGRPPNAIKQLCRDLIFNDKLIEKLGKIANNSNTQTRDQIRAIEVLMDRGFGKAEQAIELTTNESDRPTTDSLIETLSALRKELDSLRAGVGVEKAQ